MQSNSGQSSTTTTADRSLLTDKELHYLKDFMSWELLAIKKCKDAADACENPEIRSLLEKTGQKHINRFESILSHLH